MGGGGSASQHCLSICRKYVGPDIGKAVLLSNIIRSVPTSLEDRMLRASIYHQLAFSRKHCHVLSSPASTVLDSLLRPAYLFQKRATATAMAKRLEGKTIVVTGASSGIGKSIGSWHRYLCLSLRAGLIT